jgi:hypothetical protein
VGVAWDSKNANPISQNGVTCVEHFCSNSNCDLKNADQHLHITNSIMGQGYKICFHNWSPSKLLTEELNAFRLRIQVRGHMPILFIAGSRCSPYRLLRGESLFNETGSLFFAFSNSETLFAGNSTKFEKRLSKCTKVTNKKSFSLQSALLLWRWSEET